MVAPLSPKVYHIVHLDRIAPILRDGGLLSYSTVRRRGEEGTSIGMRHIKERRLALPLVSRPGLMVGACVPFYFCSRSVMLYMIDKRSSDLEYRGGQEAIVHLEADLRRTVAWAERHDLRWAFTLSNAGSGYFEDRATLADLDELNWASIGERYWMNCRSEKQAEFLVEDRFPWGLVEQVGVLTEHAGRHVIAAMQNQGHRPAVHVQRDWYY